MDFKDIQEKLQELRDRIREQGSISDADEAALKALIHDTLVNANSELETIQTKLSNVAAVRRAENDNTQLNDEQKARLSLMEKTGTGSCSVH